MVFFHVISNKNQYTKTRYIFSYRTIRRADKQIKKLQNTRQLFTLSASALLYPWQLCAISWSPGRKVWTWRELPAPTWKMPIKDDSLAPAMHWKFNQTINCWTLSLNTQILYHYRCLLLLLTNVLPNLFPNIKPNSSKFNMIFNNSISLQNDFQRETLLSSAGQAIIFFSANGVLFPRC